MNNITSGVDVCGKLVLLSYDKGGLEVQDGLGGRPGVSFHQPHELMTISELMVTLSMCP